MFQFFPSIYIIVALYIATFYVYGRAEYWRMKTFDATNTATGNKMCMRYSRFNLVLFALLFLAALFLTVVDCYMSV